MKRIPAVLAALLIALGLSSAIAPAHAGEARMESTTVVKMLPGQGHVFHEGDPVRICVGTFTVWRTDRVVHVVLEQRSAAGAHWKAIADFVSHVNKTNCLLGVVQDVSTGDVLVRARTIRNPEIERSRSRTIRIDAAS